VLLFGGSTDLGLLAGGETWLFEYQPTNVQEMNNNQKIVINRLNESMYEIEIILNDLNLSRLKIDLFNIQGVLTKSIYDEFPSLNNILKIHLNCDELINGLYFLKFSSLKFNHCEKLLIIR
jgi:hypothetical protein